jgi:polyisoprenoid-binding protein YceI
MNCASRVSTRLKIAMVALWAVLACTARASAAGTLPPAGDYPLDTAGASVAFNVTNALVTSVDGRLRRSTVA